MKGIVLLKRGTPGVASDPTDYPRAGNMGIAVKLLTVERPEHRVLWSRGKYSTASWKAEAELGEQFPMETACFVPIDVFF